MLNSGFLGYDLIPCSHREHGISSKVSVPHRGQISNDRPILYLFAFVSVIPAKVSVSLESDNCGIVSEACRFARLVSFNGINDAVVNLELISLIKDYVFSFVGWYCFGHIANIRYKTESVKLYSRLFTDYF